MHFLRRKQNFLLDKSPMAMKSDYFYSTLNLFKGSEISNTAGQFTVKG